MIESVMLPDFLDKDEVRKRLREAGAVNVVAINHGERSRTIEYVVEINPCFDPVED